MANASKDDLTSPSCVFEHQKKHLSERVELGRTAPNSARLEFSAPPSAPSLLLVSFPLCSILAGHVPRFVLQLSPPHSHPRWCAPFAKDYPGEMDELERFQLLRALGREFLGESDLLLSEELLQRLAEHLAALVEGSADDNPEVALAHVEPRALGRKVHPHHTDRHIRARSEGGGGDGEDELGVAVQASDDAEEAVGLLAWGCADSLRDFELEGDEGGADDRRRVEEGKQNLGGDGEGEVAYDRDALACLCCQCFPVVLKDVSVHHSHAWEGSAKVVDRSPIDLNGAHLGIQI
mmetsp:Transcript_11694/g.27569  ORF Transcript_11694/g.27569 Transcript_11694/m.27569 type:complete len:293 (-) Transcript_11694:467-1345(-)